METNYGDIDSNTNSFLKDDESNIDSYNVVMQPDKRDIRMENELDVVAAEGADPRDLAGSIHIWALGVVTVIGGQYYGWNVALSSGAGLYLLSQLLVGVAYVVYCSCVSEIVGAIAFSGGAYGLSRVTLGFYFGFIVGVMELLEYIAYTSVSVVWLGQYVTDELIIDSRWQFLIWAVIYALFVAVIARGDRFMWNLIVVLAIVSVLPIIVYSFGSFKFTNFSKYAPHHTGNAWFRGSFGGTFLKFLPYATWAFGGIESLSLCTSLCKNPKQTLPRGLMFSVLTLFISILLLTLIVPSLPPGILSSCQSALPLDVGFKLAFNISATVSRGLIVPAQVGMALGFVLPYGQLLQSLANSNLVPSVLGLNKQRTNVKSMFLGSCVGYMFCVMAYYSSSFCMALQNICILAACLTYFAQLTGYIMLKTVFSSIERTFVTPTGIPGAIFSMVVFGLLFISIVGGFQNDGGIATISVVIIIFIASLYYWVFGQSTQTLSAEEHKCIFRFNVINFNRRKFNAQRYGTVKPMYFLVLDKLGYSKEQVSEISSRFASFSSLKSNHQQSTRSSHFSGSKRSIRSVVPHMQEHVESEARPYVYDNSDCGDLQLPADDDDSKSQSVNASRRVLEGNSISCIHFNDKPLRLVFDDNVDIHKIERISDNWMIYSKGDMDAVNDDVSHEDDVNHDDGVVVITEKINTSVFNKKHEIVDVNGKKVDMDAYNSNNDVEEVVPVDGICRFNLEEYDNGVEVIS